MDKNEWLEAFTETKSAVIQNFSALGEIILKASEIEGISDKEIAILVALETTLLQEELMEIFDK